MKLYVFGTKHNNPYKLGSNQIFDVQGLKNPSGGWIYPLTGLHIAVYSQIIADPQFQNLLAQAINFIKGSTATEFGIQCSGGRHRSPAFAWHLGCIIGGAFFRWNKAGTGMIPNMEFIHPDVQRYYNLCDAGYDHTNNELAMRWARGEG